MKGCAERSGVSRKGCAERSGVSRKGWGEAAYPEDRTERLEVRDLRRRVLISRHPLLCSIVNPRESGKRGSRFGSAASNGRRDQEVEVGEEGRPVADNRAHMRPDQLDVLDQVVPPSPDCPPVRQQREGVPGRPAHVHPAESAVPRTVRTGSYQGSEGSLWAMVLRQQPRHPRPQPAAENECPTQTVQRHGRRQHKQPAHPY